MIIVNTPSITIPLDHFLIGAIALVVVVVCLIKLSEEFSKD